MNDRTDPAPEQDAALDRYLDGAMSANEAAEFARRLDASPKLRRASELQGQIDASLRRTTGASGGVEAVLQALPAGDDAVVGEVGAASAPPTSSGRSIWLKVAAVLVLLALGGVAAYTYIRPTSPTREPARIDVVAMYQTQQGLGFQPDWVCDQARFRRTCSEVLGANLALADTPDDRAMLGMTSLARGDGRSLVMLARARGENVMVYIDRPEQMVHYDRAEMGGLHIYETQVQGLRLIEVSPLDEPMFLDYLAVPTREESSTQTPQPGRPGR